ncbi:MAG: hypothetical protein COA86_14240 [Kangiella sp.]|nr:MAG: hypothetical protein COA86_14240 [Kangiella sp.]
MKSFVYPILILTLFACSSIPNPPVSDQSAKNEKPVELSEKQEWQNWVNKHSEGRSSKNGWLSLAGLYWLNEGDNTLGTDKSNLHLFPEGTPSFFGLVNIEKEVVTFTRKNSEIKIDDKDIESQVLVLNKTIVSLNSYSFYIIKRERGFAVRLKNTENPSIAKYDGVHFLPYSEEYAIPARLIQHKTPQTIQIATVYDTVRENDSAGWLEFEFNGQKHRLQAISYGKDGPMSLMFADETGQETTYGAGRYLDVDWPKDGSDMTVINFNYAYNPPCAITPFATCPLPPRGNRLDFNIEAGELYSNTYTDADTKH